MDGAKRAYYEGGSSPAGHTIQSLSTGTDVYTDHPTFQAFQTFYGGDVDYADRWIQAALDGTSMALGTRQVNFPTVDGRVRAVNRGTVVLNVWMAIVNSLEKALVAFDVKCGTSTSIDGIDPDSAEQEWDKAFALYTGSEVESDDPLGGYFLYRMAQVYGEQFGTNKVGEESPVNIAMIQNFVDGKNNISQLNCNGALSSSVSRMKSLLNVPIVQASLRIMYSVDNEDDVRDVIQGEKNAYGAALSPLISRCSAGPADVLYDNMFDQKSVGSFEVVKSIVEKQYDCLGITCKDVGGIITVRGDGYRLRAEACDGVQPVPGAGLGDDGGSSEGDNDGSGSQSEQPQEPPVTAQSKNSNGSNNKAIIAIVVVVSVCLVLVVLFLCGRGRCGKSASDIEMGSSAGEQKTTSDDDGETDTQANDGGDKANDDDELKVEVGEFS